MNLATPTSQTRSVDDRLSSATDEFVKAQLPDWLKRASRGQIRKLRDTFKAHQHSQARLRSATCDLLPLQRFAQQQFQHLLQDDLPAQTDIADLRWMTVTPEIPSLEGSQPFRYAPSYSYAPGLMRLMQGFEAGTRFFQGSGLGRAGSHDVLVAGDARLIERCRQLDAGTLYQEQLEQVYHEQNLALVAHDKRAGFLLALEIAVLKGQISGLQQLALREVATFIPNTIGQPLPHSVSTLQILGQQLCDALLIELRAPNDAVESVLLYVPSDPAQALQRFNSLAELHDALVTQLKTPGFRQCVARQVGLMHRPAFLRTLDNRLKDPQPDLQIERGAIVEDCFFAVARLQVQQVKDDARLLLVPTAEIDEAAARQRLLLWEASAMGLINLAGLFLPVVGALLLGQLVVQMVSEVYEGAMDWQEGHQHEALEHLLSVAETLAVATATVAAVAIVRSAFINALEPIALDTQRKRLWANDLKPYETSPGDARLQADGLYGAGPRRWLRIQSRYYEVHRPTPEDGWRLRHPSRAGAYGPRVLHNGERGWRLMGERPLEWQDSARMLDCLWPQHPPVDALHAQQILSIAGIDQDELRGILVENRPAPITLADTLRRFEAHARIEAFIGHLSEGTLAHTEGDLLAWCSAQPEVAGPSAGLRQRLIGQMPSIRWRALEHFAYGPRASGPVAAVIARDFPGLPKSYIAQVLDGLSPTALNIARAQQRVPLALANKARSLLRAARLTRAVEGFYLDGVSCSETDELAFALLPNLPGWPAELALEVREAAPDGRVVAVLGPEEPQAGRLQLVRIDRHFHLYDGQGRALSVAGPAPLNVFEAVVAALSPAQLHTLGIEQGDAAGQLRQMLAERLPAGNQGKVALLGWPVQAPWFNPGQRMANGRVGYALSGRGEGLPTSRQTLLDGLRALFPGLGDNQLNEELEGLMGGDETPFAALARLQDDHEQLNRALNRWVLAELGDARRVNRQRLADSLLRAWRGQGEFIPAADGQPAGLRMTLGFAQLASLPELPGHVTFRYVRTLVINDTAIIHVPTDFLHCFVNVRTLNLNGNRLLSIPIGLAYLQELRTVRLARNLIRLNPLTIEVLSALPRLSRLDLSYNPIGAVFLRFHRLQQLEHLSLRHCRLNTWPQYIELCPRLQVADLRDNVLSQIAPETLQMPRSFRQAFLVDHNRLSAVQVMALHALEGIPEVAELTVEPQHIRQVWLGACAAEVRFERGLTWDAVAAQNDSDAFIQLLGQLEHVADYENARDHLAEQVWALLHDMQIYPSLCSEMFQWAAEQPQAQNRVVDVFSRMQLRLLQAQAERNATQLDQVSAHIRLGFALYRLDYVALLARQTAVQLNEEREVARRAAGDEAEVAEVDVRDIDLLYRVRLREALSLPGQPRTLRGIEALGVDDALIGDVRQRIEQVGGIEDFAEDLSQRSFWQRYLGNRYASDFQAMEHAYRERIARFHAENPDATPQMRAQVLDEYEVEHHRAVNQHRVALTRYELRSDAARRG